jgi:hypothetical protein
MTPADRFLILLIVCALPFLYRHLWFDKQPGNYLQIRAGDNAPITEILNPDRLLHVNGPLGESIIEIKNGRTRFVSSPCTNKVCVQSSWISDAGGFTACLPNRISLLISGRHPRFDAINF